MTNPVESVPDQSPDFSKLGRVAKIVLNIAILACLGAIVLFLLLVGVKEIIQFPSKIFIFLAIILSLLVLSGLRFWGSIEVQVSGALFVLLTGLVLTGFETFLHWQNSQTNVSRLGLPADTRILRDVVLDLASTGKKTTIPVFPEDIDNQIEINGRPVLPFSNPPLSEVVTCNETGQWISFNSDELGYHNPRGLWQKVTANAGTDLVLVGDSYTEGWCVPSEKTFASKIRKAFPNTINIGRGGRGPLGELALIREYAPVLKPKYVVLFFFDNDFGNLAVEQHHGLMRRYLADESFSQNLYRMRKDVNREVLEYAQLSLQKLGARRQLPFYELRNWLNFQFSNDQWTQSIDWHQDPKFTELVSLYSETLKKSRDATRKAGAELVLIYLRDFRPQKDSREAKQFAKLRTNVLKIAASFGVRAYDIGLDMLKDVSDGREFHRLSTDRPLDNEWNVTRHYNILGHAAVASLTVHYLQNLVK